MSRVLAFTSLFFVLETFGFAQSKFDGKWATARGEKNWGDAELELTVDGANVKGNLNLGSRLGGTFLTFKEGKVEDSKVRFQTTVTSGNQTATTSWTAESVNDNTIVLWTWGLDLVGADVLDLVHALAEGRMQAQATPPASRAAAPTIPVPTSTSSTPAAKPVTSCNELQGAKCYLLHKSK
jgi:hypothetical protein